MTNTFQKLCLAVLLVSSAALSTIANAAPVYGTIVDRNGDPVQSALLMIRPITGSAPKPRPIEAVLSQENLQFTPYVLAVPVGSQVSFPNKDGIEHHVRSFTETKPLDFRVPATQDKPNVVVFDKAGLAPIHCLFHDWMRASVYVVDTPWYEVSNVRGNVSINVPEGQYEMQVWHPDLGAVRPMLKEKLVVGTLAQQVRLKFDFVPRKQRQPRPVAPSTQY
jgi:plastocyanin